MTNSASARLVAAGFPIGDPIAGLAVTVLILEVGFEVTRDVLHHLLDGIEPELIESVRTIAAETPGVTRFWPFAVAGPGGSFVWK